MSILDLPHIAHVVMQSHQGHELALKGSLSFNSQVEVGCIVDLRDGFQHREYFFFGELFRLFHFF